MAHEGKTRPAKNYVRLTYRRNDGSRRTVWAKKLRPITLAGTSHQVYLIVNKEGDEGLIQQQVIVLSPSHFIRERTAAWSLHYGDLVVATEPTVEIPGSI